MTRTVLPIALLTLVFALTVDRPVRALEGELILNLDPAETNTLTVDVGGLFTLQAPIFGGVVSTLSLKLSQLPDANVTIDELLFATPQLDPIPTDAICIFEHPDRFSGGPALLNLAQAPSEFDLTLELLVYVTNPDLAALFPPIPIQTNINFSQSITLGDLKEIPNGFISFQQLVQETIPPDVPILGGGTITGDLSFRSAGESPVDALTDECRAFRAAQPRDELIGSAVATTERLVDDLRVNDRELWRLRELWAPTEELSEHFFEPRYQPTDEDIDGATVLADGDVWFSCATNCRIDGTTYNNADIIAYDAQSDAYSAPYLEDDFFITAENIDALHVEENGTLLYSTAGTARLVDGETILAGEVVEYDPGTNTHTVILESRDIFDHVEDIDAVHREGDTLYLSTVGAAKIQGESVADGDVVQVDLSNLPQAGGPWSIFLTEDDIFRTNADLNAIAKIVVKPPLP